MLAKGVFRPPVDLQANTEDILLLVIALDCHLVAIDFALPSAGK